MSACMNEAPTENFLKLLQSVVKTPRTTLVLQDKNCIGIVISTPIYNIKLFPINNGYLGMEIYTTYSEFIYDFCIPRTSEAEIKIHEIFHDTVSRLKETNKEVFYEFLEYYKA